jgi:hypothetical protein
MSGQWQMECCERHKFKIGQLVDYLNREAASGVYQVTQLLPRQKAEHSSIVTRTPTSPHERTAKEHELRSAA